jgi:hypothetical protein
VVEVAVQHISTSGSPRVQAIQDVSTSEPQTVNSADEHFIRGEITTGTLEAFIMQSIHLGRNLALECSDWTTSEVRLLASVPCPSSSHVCGHNHMS